MSARAIWEATGKDLINRNLNYSNGVVKCRFAVYDQSVSWSQLVQQEPWLATEVSEANRIQCKHFQGKMFHVFKMDLTAFSKMCLEPTTVSEYKHKRQEMSIIISSR